MKIAVLGGKLQGVEAAYLAKKADWEVELIDKNPNAPAVGISDRYYEMDITKSTEIKKILKKADLIIPTLENKETLEIIEKITEEIQTPVIYDPYSYSITSSKLKSDRLFQKLKIPAPKPWPKCRVPMIAKPSGASGSEDIIKIKTQEELQEILKNNKKDWVLQEYLEGRSYSIEIIGINNKYQTFQITELEMDRDYDCKRVFASVNLSEKLKIQFSNTARKIAEEINLKGIMDVEVIHHDNKLKVLEIDARLPSQTPTAVYKSTGINMLEILSKDKLEKINIEEKEKRHVIYEHIKVTDKEIEFLGEHIMSEAGHLHIENNFFEAEEAVTNYQKGRKNWKATLINTGKNHEEVWKKRNQVIDNIKESLKN